MNSPYMNSGGTLKANSSGVFPNSVAGIRQQAGLARTELFPDAFGNYGTDPITGAPIKDKAAAQNALAQFADPNSNASRYLLSLQQERAKMAPRNNGGPMTPVGQTPYTPGMSSYQRTGFRAPTQSGRSRLDPARIAGKMARGTARPGEVAAVKMMQDQQDRELGLPMLQARAQQAEFQNSLLADPATRDMLRKRMNEILGAQDQTNTDQTNTDQTNTATPTKATTTADYTAQNGGLTPQRPSALDAAYKNGGMTRPTSSYRPTQIGARAEGGEMEMEMEDEDEDEGGEEDAYLLGEEGPEMVIKRDDGSMFVLPADVTEKIMAGITMEDTEDNQDAMAAAMKRMGMEPKMCGGKMGSRMGGGEMGGWTTQGTPSAESQWVDEYQNTLAYRRGGIQMPNVGSSKNPYQAAATGRRGGIPMPGMGSRMNGGTMMKPYMNGGTMMAQETGRMAPATSRTKTRKNVLFDAMKRLV